MKDRVRVLKASTGERDPLRAVAALRQTLDGEQTPALLIFFCAPTYDLAALAAAMGLGPNLIGCTTAGQIGPSGFEHEGITAVALYSSELIARSYVAENVAGDADSAADIATRALSDLDGKGRAFGLLFVDGLTLAEERIAATLHHALGGLPLVGGSAGDDLAFRATHVFHGGRFYRDAAVLTLCETTLPFTTFKFQHFAPTERKLVITSAKPEQRIVTEIYGRPAAEAYAEAVGVGLAELSPRVFSKNPVMLKAGGEYYVRSIQRVEPDGSLRFFCGIAEGLVLTIGRGVDALETVRTALDAAEREVGQAKVVLGCDCVLRRLELEEDSLATEVGKVYAAHNVIGFSTYGEQYNGMHVNQTFTGVALGG